LAAVGPGDTVLDVGCGDGRVVVAAALRGACARGVELEAHVAAMAQRALADWAAESA
jgi:cyclopropane fatty-acyl-phospholipid synthase-like methyltransferase